MNHRDDRDDRAEAWRRYWDTAVRRSYRRRARLVVDPNTADISIPWVPQISAFKFFYGVKERGEVMAFEVPALPYGKSALEPYMSAKTLELHHGKHHQAYVANLSNLVKNTELASATLESIIEKTANDDSKIGIFNNAAQAWNHAFFWNSMKPEGGGAPAGELAERINRDFGTFDKFKELFKKAAVGQFGSGWAWLVLDKNELRVANTSNAMTPVVSGQTPLLTCDVWEHAYYLDYQNRRTEFVEAFLDRLANWDFATKNLASAK